MLSITACLLTIAAAEPPPRLFHPPAMWCWDNWFCHDGERYHAFFLQLPWAVGPERRWQSTGNKHAGHAVSSDLLTWEYAGPVIVPMRGTWCDLEVATGSVVRHAGRWWTLYTGSGTRVSGVGLAVSDDLFRWSAVGDGPVVRFDTVFTSDGSNFGGEPVRWRGLADPYVLPEPIDGWYYLVLNARVQGVPAHLSGCLGLLRSRDLLAWEEAGVLAWPRWFERLETPQLWAADGRWYLYCGGAQDSPTPAEFIAGLPAQIGERKRVNLVLTSETMAGPFVAGEDAWLSFPGYIAKRLAAPDGQDVMIYTQADSISPPQRIGYTPGGLRLVGPWAPAE